MREIKFRAKSINSKDWIYGLPSYHFKYLFNEDNLDSFDNYEVFPETIGQYTGLKDKNGVEIYEGDIVKYGDLDITPEIKWDKRACNFGFCHELYTDRIQVIGNIHDK